MCGPQMLFDKGKISKEHSSKTFKCEYNFGDTVLVNGVE